MSPILFHYTLVFSDEDMLWGHVEFQALCNSATGLRTSHYSVVFLTQVETVSSRADEISEGVSGLVQTPHNITSVYGRIVLPRLLSEYLISKDKHPYPGPPCSGALVYPIPVLGSDTFSSHL